MSAPKKFFDTQIVVGSADQIMGLVRAAEWVFCHGKVIHSAVLTCRSFSWVLQAIEGGKITLARITPEWYAWAAKRRAEGKPTERERKPFAYPATLKPTAAQRAAIRAAVLDAVWIRGAPHLSLKGAEILRAAGVGTRIFRLTNLRELLADQGLLEYKKEETK